MRVNIRVFVLLPFEVLAAAKNPKSKIEIGHFSCRTRQFHSAWRMGSKYVPSIKDIKAGQRFQQMQRTQSKFIKPAPKPAVKTAGKRKSGET